MVQQPHSWAHPEKTLIRKYTCTPVFTAALFTIAKTWKQPKCPLRDEWVKKMGYVCVYTYIYVCVYVYIYIYIYKMEY